jgi:isopentenyl phosphate kinase
MLELTLIKLGGSLITDKAKPFTARKALMGRIADELKSIKRIYKGQIIIGHGSGSFAHTPAAKYQTQKGIINSNSLKGFPLVADAARLINEITIDIFLKKGLPVLSFSPLSFIYTKKEKSASFLVDPIKKALSLGFVPVIYGDVIMDENMGFCIYSGEKTINLLAKALKKDYKKISIIYCGETNGVYDGFGKTIAKITPKNYKDYKSSIKGAKETDVTGGMVHKVEESLLIAKSLGIQTLIINGKIKGEIKRAMLGKKIKGTRITN